MEEMKNVAETYKICESSETHTSQNISCMSVDQLISFNNSTFEGLKIIYCFSIYLLTGMQKHTK
jgi:hypothetical protein